MTWTPDDEAVERALQAWWHGPDDNTSAQDDMRAALVAAVGELIDMQDIEIEGAMNDRAAMRKERDELRAELESEERERMKTLDKFMKTAHERDSLREQVSDLRGKIGIALPMIRDLTRERDELRAEFERVKRELEAERAKAGP